MTTYRIKLQAPLREFEAELDRMIRLDAENQKKYSPGPGRPASGRLSSRQLYLLTEGIFFAAYRGFENLVRDVFLLYCLEKRPLSGRSVRSYLAPRSFGHAEELTLSSMRYLDWTNPEHLLERAERYLEDGFPIKQALVTRMDTLQDLKRLRNHIAHTSAESERAYRVVLRNHYGVVPLRVPSAGEFLLQTDKRDPGRYKLLAYLEFMRSTSRSMVGL